MGCYVNPPTTSKEVWLTLNGKTITPDEAKISNTEMPVCLVNNGAFTAAAVCYKDDEIAAFNDPRDNRPKLWYSVPIEKLKEVSPLKHYV